jgi:hypothetical protein
MTRRYKRDRQVQVFDMIVGGIGRLISQPFRKISPVRRKKISLAEAEDEFRRLRGIMKLGGEAHFRQAIVEADNFLDRVLRSKGLSGSSLGERLKQARRLFSPDINQAAWQAHKIRNRIVHENDFELLSFQAKKTIKNFERTIKFLLD